MPVEVELLISERKVSAVIRDVSFDEESGAAFFGIGVHHSEAIPLDVSVGCRLVSATDVLPKLSQVTLMWTRQFGVDGILSGGRMYREAAAGSGDEPL